MMLMLTRKQGEKIVVGMAGEVLVTIVEIRGDRVRVGVEAPKDIPVDRLEVYQAKRRNEQLEQG